METQKIEPERKEECSHIDFNIIDSGMLLIGEGGRDIGIGCADCGLEWDVRLFRGSSKSTIKLRQSKAEEYDANKILLKSFISYLKEHEMTICFYDEGRKNPEDTSVKGFYQISYDDDLIDRRLTSFLAELRRC